MNAGNEWRSMDDAPKDRHILVMADGKPIWVEWNEAWGGEGWFVINGGCLTVQPTAWLKQINK